MQTCPPSTALLETIAVRDGTPLALADHQARLQASWGEALPGRPANLREEVRRALSLAGRGTGLLRLEFRPQDSAVSVSRSVRPLRRRPRQVTVACSAQPRAGTPESRRHKWAARAWVDEHSVTGAFETLLWDHSGQLLEGTRCNVFVETTEGWRTPPAAAGLVPGVVRGLVLKIASRRGLPVREAPVSRRELEDARGVFLSGTGMGLIAVDRLDEVELPGARSPLLHDLRAHLGWIDLSEQGSAQPRSFTEAILGGTI